MPVPAETCGECGFDGAGYGLQDTLGTLRALAPMWSQTVEGVADDGRLRARPAAGVWSVTEYAAHSADVIEGMGRLLHAALTTDGVVIPELDPPEPSPVEDLQAAIARLGANAARLHAKAQSFGPARGLRWTRTVTLGDRPVDAAWIVRHAVHDATHHLHDAGRGLHALGAGAPTQRGTVAGLHRSDGGVPKGAIERAEVNRRGVVGDRQAARQHHGKPMQALCLWSAEVLEALQAEGHPIAAGRAGENVTVVGIDWTTIRPGVQLRLGEVLAEISAYAVPCSKNGPWFVDGNFQRMAHERHPGWSRAYAWVREPGSVGVGDAVVVEPESGT